MSNEIVRQLAKAGHPPLVSVASRIASGLVDLARGQVVGVTGPSSVGKSTFSQAIREEVLRRGLTVEVVGADHFLRPELRGETHYREGQDTPLTPEDFDFDALSRLIAALRAGCSVDFDTYDRGLGWRGIDRHLEPVEILLVEGLFLDSVQAARAIDFDLVILLEAPWDTIASSRRHRDEQFRQTGSGSFRSRQETEEEIRRTQESYLKYERSKLPRRRLAMRFDSDLHLADVR
ncbi:hypothetical protein GCM10009836_20410 [Pseudonocardia ailaonensis]|uniref:Phosphoribulokinase/uridine kinase domain-containing protein n=1 Tax=Pseudonocardia ailaonensis TaxID=367279 RepID=A0ABN2MXN1_9PSEU